MCDGLYKFLLVSQTHSESGCGLVPSGGAYVLLLVFFVDKSSRWETMTAFCFSLR